MIKLTQLATEIEKALNAQFEAIFKSNDIQLKIWAGVGKYKKARRNGNKINYFINANLRTTTSANEANDLIMGVNGLSLELSVPVKIPRTNATQTSEQLNEIEDGQFQFVHNVAAALDSYFQRPTVVMLTDEDGVTFTISYQGGAAMIGDIDLASRLNENVPLTVYLEMYFLEGGINSKSVVVYLDDSKVPYTALRQGRTPMLETDVYAGELVSKNIITSTAFAIDVDFPANADLATQECIDYLLNAEPNKAHFVKVVFGLNNEKLFLMTLNTLQTSAMGITIAGLSASLIEVVPNPVTVNVPESFEIGRFMFSSTLATSISFDPRTNGTAYIAGKFYDIPSNVHTMSVPVEAKDYVYDEETNRYYIYVIANKNRIFTGNPNYSVVKAAQNG